MIRLSAVRQQTLPLETVSNGWLGQRIDATLRMQDFVVLEVYGGRHGQEICRLQGISV
jgi:hypothetical protein